MRGNPDDQHVSSKTAGLTITQQVCLKEYETLRAEIIAIAARGDSNQRMVWAGVAVIMGAAAYAQVPELGFIALFWPFRSGE